MKKNDMLNEGTIRRFMKLATIDGLSDKFVAENLEEASEEVEEGRMRAKRDDEEMREGEEDLEEGKHEDDDLDEMRDKRDDDEMDEMRDKRDDDEMREGEHEDGEPAAGGMVSVDQLMSALEKALEDVLGQEVEVSKDDDEMEMDMDMDMDAADAGEEMDMDLGADDDEPELEEVNDDVIEEVFARVIQRLKQGTKSSE